MDNSKRKVLGSILGIIIFIICILSLSYAWYRWRSANTDVDIGIHEGGLKFVYSDSNILESSNLSPILDYKDDIYYTNNNGSLIYADYTTTNTTDDTYKMIIKLNVSLLSDVLKDSTFKWVLLEKVDGSYSKVVNEGNFSDVVVGSNILNSGIYVPPSSPTGSTSTDYRFVIYIDGNMENSSGMMNSTIKADLELCDEKVSVININLDNQGAESGQGGTATIYEKYGVGIYKDSNANTTLMTPTSNPITIPSKDGYVFGGYYEKVQGYEEQISTSTTKVYIPSSTIYNSSSYAFDESTGNYILNDVESDCGGSSSVCSMYMVNRYFCDSNDIISTDSNSATCKKMYKGTSYGVDSTGYYSEATTYSSTSEEVYGNQLINAQGYITNKFSNTYFDKTATLYAKWEINSYNIAYIYNGGIAGADAPTTGEYDAVVNISNPTKTVTVTGNINGTGAIVGASTNKAQVFAGWTSSSSEGLGNNAKTGTSTNPTTNWTGSATKNTYFKNLRDTSGTVTLTATWTPVAFNLPTVAKTGYTCEWNTKANGTGTSYESGASYTPTATSSSTVTMYAICTSNTYNIAYEYNNGTAGNNAPDSGTFDEDVNISNPTKTITVAGDANGTGATVGASTSQVQTFAGWTSSGSAGLSTATAKVGNSANPTNNWTGSATKGTYFRNLRASNGTVTLTATWTPVAFNLPTVTKPGNTCEWNTKADGTGTSYASGASYTPTATSDTSLTMYAVCSFNSYTVTYDYETNGGTSATKENDTVESGSNIDLTPTATKSGWTFIGWNTDKDATEALDSLEMSTSNVTLYAIFKKEVTGTFYYYDSGIKNTTESCTMYNTATSCSITVPTATFSSTTSQYGASYVGYGAVNTMGNSTATSVSISANTSYYASYRKNVTEYYQNTSRTIYRNAFFTSNSAMNTVLSTSATGTSNLTGASYTANSINWSWYGYATSSSDTSRTYSSVSEAAKSTTETLYTMYSKNVTATFYYYNGSSQATTTGSGTQLADYQATIVSNGNITVPTTVTNSNGPSSIGTDCSGTTVTNTTSYYGVSSSISDITTVTPSTEITTYYTIYESSFSADYNKGVGIDTIGSTTNSCTNYKTTNGTSYSSTSCDVTLPAITALDGYVSQGWFEGITTSISETTGDKPSTSISLNSNTCYTARSRYLRADELIYDNYLTGEHCDTAQCMIDRINRLIDLEEGNTTTSATNKIMDLYHEGPSVNGANIGGDTTKPVVKLNPTAGIMVDNNWNYRYYGSNPNNYITFNDETWRIIGAFHDIDDGTGKKETRLKIVRNESIGSYSWDSSASTINTGYGVNDWSKSDLMTELNTLYYNSSSGTCYNAENNTYTACSFTSTGLDSEARSMIDDAVYNLGVQSNKSGFYPNDFYDSERDKIVFGCDTDDGACPRAITWTGKVGLIYASDYLYSTDLSKCTWDSTEYSRPKCINNNWLRLSTESEFWTITPHSSATRAFNVDADGRINAHYNSRSYLVYPTVYLSSSAVIVSGDGTSSNPYKLG